MEDNRYLEQAAALLDKAKEAGEIMGVVLVTSGYKACVKMNGSGAALINTMIDLPKSGDKFNSILALVVATWIVGSNGFAEKLDALLCNPKELKNFLQKSSDKLDAEIAESKARWEASEDETEKEESHDSEEAA